MKAAGLGRSRGLARSVRPGRQPRRMVELVGQDRADLPYRAYWLTIGGDRNEYRTLLVTRGSIDTLAGQSSVVGVPVRQLRDDLPDVRQAIWNKAFR